MLEWTLHMLNRAWVPRSDSCLILVWESVAFKDIEMPMAVMDSKRLVKSVPQAL